MYAGHAAVALALKAREPRLPIVPMALACYGPDWVEAALLFPHPREGMAPYTHSILAVLIGASLFAAVYAIATRRPGARWLMVGWLLHWPADFLTGLKPLTGLNDIVGLDLYRLPLVDFALESVVIVIGCGLYARRFARSEARRRLVVALGVALVVAQALLDLSLSRTPEDWRPSLARGRWRPHLPLARSAAGWPALRMPLALSRPISDASMQWQRMASRG